MHRVDTALLLVHSNTHHLEVSIGYQYVSSKKDWKDKKLPPDAGEVQEPYFCVERQPGKQTKNLTYVVFI
jgi:hypothetical protein